MIELEAKDKGFCVARIDINESDVSSQMVFFFKIFDSIFNSVCAFSFINEIDKEVYKPYGGFCGRTYETYIDLISTYNTNQDKQWCPFIFPLQYAKAATGLLDIDKCKVSDHIIRNDLSLLRKECKKIIVMLFDECDCINKYVILLEMLRNIFMNLLISAIYT